MNRKRSRSRWAEILGHDTEISGHVGPKYPPDIDAAVLDAAGNHAYSEKEAHYEMEGASSSELKDEVPEVGPGEQQQRTVTLAFSRVVADG
jgi:hypothetical protein